jgi:hypothetical protein
VGVCFFLFFFFSLSPPLGSIGRLAAPSLPCRAGRTGQPSFRLIVGRGFERGAQLPFGAAPLQKKEKKRKKMSSDEVQYDRLTHHLESTQSDETALFQSLDNPTLTPVQRYAIIQAINRSAHTRITLYRALQDIYTTAKEEKSQMKELIDRQMRAIELIEHEMNRKKEKLNRGVEKKQDLLRMVEITDYYKGQYSAHSALLRTTSMLCVPAVLLSLLHKMGFLPRMLYGLFSILLLVYAAYIIGPIIIDLSNRDSMVWDQYNLAFQSSKAPQPAASASASASSASSSSAFSPGTTSPA